MPNSNDFTLLARYNQWMNARLYAAAADLDAAERRADRGAFFGSILATLHHVFSSDVHWLKRLADGAPALASLEGIRAMPMPELVRHITYPDFAWLHAQRLQVDAAIVAFADEADEAIGLRPLHYINSAGESHCKPYGLVLRHFFNHQSHHRGQVTTLFSQLGVDVGSTDLIDLVPEFGNDPSSYGV